MVMTVVVVVVAIDVDQEIKKVGPAQNHVGFYVY
jgi:hypothetical protein